MKTFRGKFCIEVVKRRQYDNVISRKSNLFSQIDHIISMGLIHATQVNQKFGINSGTTFLKITA